MMPRGGITVFAALVRSAAIGAGLALGGIGGCDSPWERAVTKAPEAEVPHEIYASGAHLGTWLDKRERAEIRHGMLVVEGLKPQRGYFAPGSTVVITTTSTGIAQHADEMMENARRLPPGMRTNFALGTTVSVRIERIGIGGVREPLAEGRVSFLEIAIADPDGQ